MNEEDRQKNRESISDSKTLVTEGDTKGGEAGIGVPKSLGIYVYQLDTKYRVEALKGSNSILGIKLGPKGIQNWYQVSIWGTFVLKLACLLADDTRFGKHNDAF